MSTLTDPVAAVDWDLWSTTARLVVTRPDVLADARAVCADVLAEIDRAANRFDPSSELCRIGDAGGTHTVSPLLSDLIAEALTAAAATGGAVDPTIGGTLVDLGYDRDITLVQRGGRLTARIRRVRGWRTVHLDGDRVTLPNAVRLDLGATAKASAADRCARAVVAATGAGALVALGGDIATAGRAPAGGWQVTVQDLALDPRVQLALPAGSAVSTSSTRRRTWRQGALDRHHIVDPSTARPVVDTWAAVCVVAPTCLVANTVSTAAIVKGRAGLGWLDATGLPARVLDRDGTVHRLNGWPEDV